MRIFETYIIKDQYFLYSTNRVSQTYRHLFILPRRPGCLICWCAPIGNMLLADKMGLEGFEYKYLALGDYIGGGGICTFISSMLVRQKVRERYGIPGSAGGDCIVSCCCTVCSLCQMTKQVNDH